MATSSWYWEIFLLLWELGSSLRVFDEAVRLCGARLFTDSKRQMSWPSTVVHGQSKGRGAACSPWGFSWLGQGHGHNMFDHRRAARVKHGRFHGNIWLSTSIQALLHAKAWSATTGRLLQPKQAFTFAAQILIPVITNLHSSHYSRSFIKITQPNQVLVSNPEVTNTRKHLRYKNCSGTKNDNTK
jgi:hypothetical protein